MGQFKFLSSKSEANPDEFDDSDYAESYTQTKQASNLGTKYKTHVLFIA